VEELSDALGFELPSSLAGPVETPSALPFDAVWPERSAANEGGGEGEASPEGDAAAEHPEGAERPEPAER